MSNVVLVFGTGPKIGLSLVKKFLSAHYKVVSISRSASLPELESSENHHHFQADLTDISNVNKAFTKTRELYGEPRVVIHNAAAVHFSSGKSDAFDTDVKDIIEDTNVNTFSLYVAIQEAVKSFKTFGKDETKPKVLIYTGNLQNVRPFPSLTSAGAGKAASYSLLSNASVAFSDSEYGYKFYYADERAADGNIVARGNVSGEGAADFYYGLAEGVLKDVPVEATFVTGLGYKFFNENLA